jgi:D-alanyl-D-alanine carboxypeptidase/D-alanyl-D-alanine-endopeptidase (penicillin-binding protein 4)
LHLISLVMARCSKRRCALLAIICALTAAAAVAQELPDPIERALAGLGIPAEDVSILVHRIGATEPLLSHLPDVPRNPASVMKLVTTWSALQMLGPDFTWPTEVYFDGDFDGTTLYGDLGIKGYGDPYMVLEQFWKLLRTLKRIGLSDIQGNLVLDDRHFDIPPEDPGAFDGQPYRTYNVVPNALLANFKAVQFFFLADPANDRVLITSDPVLPNLDIRNRLELADGPCRGYQGGISFNIADPDTVARVVFEGAFPARCNTYSLTRSVLQHDTYLYGLFRSIWGELGGSLRGRMVTGPIPEGAALIYTWRSPPLGEVIRSINKNSNNVMTRHLLLTIGAEHVGVPGTEVQGIEAVHEFLRARGLHDGSLVMRNGAGLSREGRVSATMPSRLNSWRHSRSPASTARRVVASMSPRGTESCMSRRAAWTMYRRWPASLTPTTAASMHSHSS